MNEFDEMFQNAKRALELHSKTIKICAQKAQIADDEQAIRIHNIVLGVRESLESMLKAIQEVLKYLKLAELPSMNFDRLMQAIVFHFFETSDLLNYGTLDPI